MSTQIHNWNENPLFEGLSPEELDIATSLAKEIRFEKGDLIVEEGNLGEQFFFILSGSLEVLKNGHRVYVLNKGDVVGELALLKSVPRIATVRTLEPSVVQELNVKKLPASIRSKLSKNLSYLFSARLSTTNQLTAYALKKEIYQAKRQKAMSSYAAKIIISVFLYGIFARQVLHFLPNYYFPIFSSIYLGAMTCFFCLDLSKRYPLHLFGLTLRRWKRSLQETFLIVLPLLFCVVIIKKILILTNDTYAHQPLFRFGIEMTSVDEKLFFNLAFILYVLFCPIQELIFRGFAQTLWQRLSVGSHRTFMAILVSSTLQISTHFYWSYSIATLFPNLLWGWLFARQRTLIGVGLGHSLLSIWVFWVVGFLF